MRASPFLVLVLLGATPAGCNRIVSGERTVHTEPPMQTETRLTPQRNTLRLRTVLEPHWPHQPDTTLGKWEVHDTFTVSVSVQWVNLGPDPAPSVVELRSAGSGSLAETALMVDANEGGNALLTTTFDFDSCGTPCAFNLDLVWHHAPSGELHVDWHVLASRSAYRDKPRTSYTLGYRVIPDTALRRADGHPKARVTADP